MPPNTVVRLAAEPIDDHLYYWHSGWSPGYLAVKRAEGRLDDLSRQHAAMHDRGLVEDHRHDEVTDPLAEPFIPDEPLTPPF